MKLSIIGSRGIPANYGGFEVFTEELSTRLVKKDYEVVVTCETQTNNRLDCFKGVKLFHFPYKSPNSYALRKLFEAMTDIYFLAKLAKKSDVIYLLGMTAGWATAIPYLLNRKVKVVINIDGVEWKRDKFNAIEKAFLKVNTRIAEIFCDYIIVDAQGMRNYIKKQSLKKAVFIPYGVADQQIYKWDITRVRSLLSRKNLPNTIQINNYWLVVARLEPENNIHTIVEGFLSSKSHKNLVIIGNYTDPNYQRRVEDMVSKAGGERVLFLGGIYQDEILLNMLRQNCFAYIHGHSVGGTNPSLLEAMSMGSVIVAHSNEFNHEVCEDTAVYFDTADSLKMIVEAIEADPNNYTHLKKEATDRVKENYSWDDVSEQYNMFFQKIGVIRD